MSSFRFRKSPSKKLENSIGDDAAWKKSYLDVPDLK